MCHSIYINFEHLYLEKYDKFIGIKDFSVKDNILYPYYWKGKYKYEIKNSKIYITERYKNNKQQVDFQFCSFTPDYVDKKYVYLNSRILHVPNIANGLHIYPIFSITRLNDKPTTIRAINNTEFNSMYSPSYGVDRFYSYNDLTGKGITLYVEFSFEDILFVSNANVSVKRLRILDPVEQLETLDTLKNLYGIDIKENFYFKEFINEKFTKIYDNILKNNRRNKNVS